MTQQRDLLPNLIQIAEVNLPQLKHEIDNNGSSIFKLQAAVSELHTIVTYVTHHMIDERRRLMTLAGTSVPAPQVPPQAQAQQAPAAQAPQRQVPSPSQRPVLPPLSPAAAMPIAQPAQAVPGQGRVIDVTITPTGTRATIPGVSTPVIVPPGAPIDTTVFDAPAQPPEGVMLPPGGEMSPEVAAALGARNITNEPTAG